MRAAQVLPLYAAAHGATATGVGLIIGAHMTVAAVGSIPLGQVSDVWGRRPLLLGGMARGVVTSLLLPLVEGQFALMMIYGLAGFGVAAFTPSALSLVGARPRQAGGAGLRVVFDGPLRRHRDRTVRRRDRGGPMWGRSRWVRSPRTRGTPQASQRGAPRAPSARSPAPF